MANRIISALMLIIILCALLAGCGKGGGGAAVTTAAADDTTAAAETEPVDALEARKLISDDLGDYDFGGRDFRVVVSDGKDDFICIEEATGDVVDDAVYARNRDISERFNCTVVIGYTGNYDSCYNWMHNQIVAGEDAFELGSVHVVKFGGVATSGEYLNWYDLPNINFDKPWWSDSNADVLTVNGVCILAVGDFAVTVGQTYCVFYNKRLGNDFNVGDIYSIVRGGDWTIDRLVAISKGIYTDVNGNNEEDNEDIYGFVSNHQSNLNAYLWAFDNPIFTKKGDTIEFTYKSEKLNQIFVKLNQVFHETEGVRMDISYVGATGSTHAFSADMFANSRCVFANGYIGTSLTDFRDLEDDFGFLPYPKWDENQDSYYTQADGHHMILGIPVTIQDTEYVGAVTEALNAETYKQVIPAYYDVALKVKATRDADSVEMLDIITSTCVYDFGYVYDYWKGCSFIIQRLVKDNNSNFESHWASQESAVLAHYDKVIEAFVNYGN